MKAGHKRGQRQFHSRAPDLQGSERALASPSDTSTTLSPNIGTYCSYGGPAKSGADSLQHIVTISGPTSAKQVETAVQGSIKVPGSSGPPVTQITYNFHVQDQCERCRDRMMASSVAGAATNY